MGLSIVTPPALDPISIAEAKAQCRVDIGDDDGSIAGYVLAARQHAESYLNRALIDTTFDLTIDYDWPCREYRHRIVLPRAPAAHPTSISYVDGNGTTQTLSPSLYVSGVLNTDERVIEPAYGATWPQVRCQLAAITVRFVAGYGQSPGDVPEDIRQGIKLIIEHLYEHRGDTDEPIPEAAQALLYKHRLGII